MDTVMDIIAFALAPNPAVRTVVRESAAHAVVTMWSGDVIDIDLSAVAGG